MGERLLLSATSSALRAEPRHGAEQVSRLLLNEAFEVLEEADHGRWLRGRGPDGYEGWLRGWHLQPGRLPDGDSLMVTARWSRALVAPVAGAEPMLDLSFGTRLVPEAEARQGYLPWRLPDGRLAWTPRDDLEAQGPGEDPKALLGSRGRRLLGVPYEWGGRSSAGMDCSGFVQLLFASLGIALPRDAWQQAEAGAPLALDVPELWRPGDLLFFGPERIEHVGVWMGPDLLLHASGEVKLERLDPGGRLPGAGRPAPVALRRHLAI